MGQIEIKLTETETKKVTYFPCTKCGSQNIAFGNCGYSSFNVAWGKCKDCNNEAIIYNCEWNISEEK